MTHPKLIQVLIQQTPRAMFALLVVSMIYFYIFIEFIPLYILTIWFVFQMVLVLGRFYNIKQFEKYLVQQAQAPAQTALKKHQSCFVWLNLFQALMWSISSVLVVVFAPQPYELVSLVMSIGIITAAALSMSTLYFAYLVFFFAMLTPQVIILFYYSEHQHFALIALTLIFIPAIILLSKAIYQAHLTNIKVNDDLEKTVKELHKLSMIDPLTNIYNRRYFFKVSKDLITLAQRERKNVVLMMVDIDYFKNINDAYGHDAGDYILINVVKEIENVLRKSDVFARVGGEEFAILLHDTSIAGANVIAEKIRFTIEKSRFNYNEITIKLTLSIGLSALSEQSNSIERLYTIADKHLYIAKESGRNKVVS